jgi:hypothetical protein
VLVLGAKTMELSRLTSNWHSVNIVTWYELHTTLLQSQVKEVMTVHAHVERFRMLTLNEICSICQTCVSLYSLSFKVSLHASCSLTEQSSSTICNSGLYIPLSTSLFRTSIREAVEYLPIVVF